MVHADLTDAPALMAAAIAGWGCRRWWPRNWSNGRSWALTGFQIGADGFRRSMLVVGATRHHRHPPDARRPSNWARNLPPDGLARPARVKSLGPMLAEAESALQPTITARLEARAASDEALLDTLVSLAAGGRRRATA